eukprot:19191-Prymnesium_polylepis.1
MSGLPVFSSRAPGRPATNPPSSVLIRSLCNSRIEISRSSLPTRAFLPVSSFLMNSVSFAIGEGTTRGCARIQSCSAIRSSG